MTRKSFIIHEIQVSQQKNNKVKEPKMKNNENLIRKKPKTCDIIRCLLDKLFILKIKNYSRIIILKKLNTNILVYLKQKKQKLKQLATFVIKQKEN